MPQNEYKGKTKKEYQHEWKTKNREKQRQLQRDHYNKKKDYLLENVGRSCVYCGSVSNIEFDHIMPRTSTEKEKQTRIRTGNSGGNVVWNKRPSAMSWKHIEKEIPHLQSLCRDCHRKKSNAQLAAAWELFCSLTLEEQNKLTNLQYEKNEILR
jgi:5-methylcytosine-specific restriction endonuclease McrA